MSATPFRKRRPSPADRTRSRAGFTLLELLLVLAILVVIGGIAGANLFSVSDDANKKATETQLKQLKTVVQMYRMRMNAYPETLENLKTGPSDSAQKAKWGKPLMDDIPGDAWGAEIVYSLNGNEFELRSNGSDGQPSTEDDIVETGS